MLIAFGTVVLFVILGIIFSTGKGAFLIAGYNTASKKEKEKYDEKALCKFMGKGMFGLAFSTLLWALSDIYAIKWLFYVGLVLYIIVIIFIIVYANTSKTIKKK